MRLACLLALLAGTAAAQTPAEDAAAAQARLQAASAQLEAATGRNDRVRAFTETVTAYEDGLIAMREGLRRVAIRKRQVQAALDAKSAEVGQLLGVLQSMGRAPAPVLLLHPDGPMGTVRGGMIAADVTPALQAEVDRLRSDLQELAVLEQLQETATDTLEEGLRGAQEARTELAEAISNRTDLPQRFTEDPVQTALLLASTETLSDFASGMSGAVLNDDLSLTAAAGKGDLPLPVQGRVLRGFNQADAAGVTRPGVILSARPRALVTAPSAATVLFRGPLLDYGNVVILEPAADILFVIAGLAEVYAEPGRVIPAGDPIGLMGGEAPSGDAILTETDGAAASSATETLYLEVRDGQSPVDPATWFATDLE